MGPVGSKYYFLRMSVRLSVSLSLSLYPSDSLICMSVCLLRRRSFDSDIKGARDDEFRGFRGAEAREQDGAKSCKSPSLLQGAQLL